MLRADDGSLHERRADKPANALRSEMTLSTAVAPEVIAAPTNPRTRFRDTLIVAVVATALIIGRAQAQTPGQPITVGETFVVPSSVMGEDRRVMISLPESYGQTRSGYPVLFLLDGSSHIVHGGALVRYLVTARNRIPEMIVVALPNTNRNRDMTPGPGAVHYQKYLAEELIPWVEQHYRTVPERVVVGHSLSASFVVHTLLNRPALFDGYIAA